MASLRRLAKPSSDVRTRSSKASARDSICICSNTLQSRRGVASSLGCRCLEARVDGQLGCPAARRSLAGAHAKGAAFRLADAAVEWPADDAARLLRPLRMASPWPPHSFGGNRRTDDRSTFGASVRSSSQVWPSTTMGAKRSSSPATRNSSRHAEARRAVGCRHARRRPLSARGRASTRPSAGARSTRRAHSRRSTKAMPRSASRPATPSTAGCPTRAAVDGHASTAGCPTRAAVDGHAQHCGVPDACGG